MTERFALVVAAQSGDRRALGELVSGHLPLVYNAIGRAVGAHADIDDAVRETIRRVARELPDLRDPATFRSWLLVCAMRQASRVRRGGPRVVMPEDGDAPDPGADFTGLSIIRLNLSGQRRRLAEAVRWLDAEHTGVLSLWWLEAAGAIGRSESAAALRLSVPDASARIDRMHEQLDVVRALVSALRARPACPGLRMVTTGWDHRPGPAWRRRIVRHVEHCPVCTTTAAHLIPAERLIGGLALVPVPNTLLAALHSDGLLAERPVPAAVVHSRGTVYEPLELLMSAPVVDERPARRPSAALVLASVTALLILAAGGAVAMTGQGEEPLPVPVAAAEVPPFRPAEPAVPSSSPSQSPSQSPSASPSPSESPEAVAEVVAPPPSSEAPAPAPAPPGHPAAAQTPSPTPPRQEDTLRSLSAANAPGRYVRERNGYAMLDAVSASRATEFTVVPGLAAADCLSLRLPDGRYLRHFNYRLRASGDDGSALFRADATFCPLDGGSGTVVLRSFNYPNHVVRHRDYALYIDRPDGSRAFARDAAWLLG
ncbi:AbfB domain-containing protein [Catenuloplanes japonicus]|uniref:AbfB domain-containing protein n=1 Tax=Catenuloplanes japonicus TaxID=33876 RepID=UPI000525D1B4|nr:AbfB domain-containing protein [Catenuloplanes japonicus]